MDSSSSTSSFFDVFGFKGVVGVFGFKGVSGLPARKRYLNC